MNNPKNNVWYDLDWITIGLYFLLVILGWLNIYSAVFNEEQQQGFHFGTRYGKQLIWIGAAFFIIVIALVVDSKFYSSFAYIIYGLSILLLIAVLIVGTRINGAQSWLVIGPIQFQPAEFTKIATALAMAKYLSHYSLKPEKFKTLVMFFTIIGIPTLFILLQNDTGSALVFFIFILVFYREGMPSVYMLFGLLAVALFILAMLFEYYIIILILEVLALLAFYVLYRRRKDTILAASILVISSVLVGAIINYFNPDVSVTFLLLIALLFSTLFFVYILFKNKLNGGFVILAVLFASLLYAYSVDYFFDNVLDGYQQRRIKVLLGIQSDPYGAGYNVNQSMIAIGSGGPTGKGYLLGTQTKFKFVPEQSTDFIFCTVGEEWGFVGSTIVLSLFLALLMRIIIMAERQKSKFSRIYGYCVASILFFHVAINVGMTIGLAPVIGIPLPFFSYGGSSLWGFTFLLFIFVKLDSNRTQLIT
ncbi:MAG: rod shape-determining protein RodA [Salinivirgaceae bacterium]